MQLSENKLIPPPDVLQSLPDVGQLPVELRRQQREWENIFQSINNPIMILDPDHGVTEVNQAMEGATGKPTEELLGKKCYEIFHHTCQAAPNCPMERMLKEGKLHTYKTTIAEVNGLDSSFLVSCAPVMDKEGRIEKIVHIVVNIDQQKETENKLKEMNRSLEKRVAQRTRELRKLDGKLKSEAHQHQRALEVLAMVDSLTGLSNRRAFFDEFYKALAQAKRNRYQLALLLLDLDGFKKINDTFGHETGDMILKEAANRFRNCVRWSDPLARVGGDEFTVILSGISDERAAGTVARKIINSLNKPFFLKNHECFLGISIGISLYPADGDDIQTLLSYADIAMNCAKKVSRNGIQLYNPKMNIRSIERLTLENDLRWALERKEFVLYYQPQLDIPSSRIIGAEALVRWQRPKLGLVPPGDFIPITEETGLITRLDEWGLYAACAQNKAWQKAGYPPIRMAVNMSGLCFRQPKQIDIINKVLDETGLSPEYLELELTETVIMQDAESSAEAMKFLKENGIYLAVDDFGTGYSSLSYLKQLPIYKLKIDISFIRNLTVDQDDVAIVTAIITMAHSLNLKVIAEGVETREQLEVLRFLGCDEYQGFLFSRAVPANDFTRFFIS